MLQVSSWDRHFQHLVWWSVCCWSSRCKWRMHSSMSSPFPAASACPHEGCNSSKSKHVMHTTSAIVCVHHMSFFRPSRTCNCYMTRIAAPFRVAAPSFPTKSVASRFILPGCKVLSCCQCSCIANYKNQAIGSKHTGAVIWAAGA